MNKRINYWNKSYKTKNFNILRALFFFNFQINISFKTDEPNNYLNLIRRTISTKNWDERKNVKKKFWLKKILKRTLYIYILFIFVFIKLLFF